MTLRLRSETFFFYRKNDFYVYFEFDTNKPRLSYVISEGYPRYRACPLFNFVCDFASFSNFNDTVLNVKEIRRVVY